MLPRLVNICSLQIQKLIDPFDALKVYLVAHSYGAIELERFSLHFMALKEEEVK
jgi:hypothetical protein